VGSPSRASPSALSGAHYYLILCIARDKCAILNLTNSERYNVNIEYVYAHYASYCQLIDIRPLPILTSIVVLYIYDTATTWDKPVGQDGYRFASAERVKLAGALSTAQELTAPFYISKVDHMSKNPLGASIALREAVFGET
jgi:hypothetical protein